MINNYNFKTISGEIIREVNEMVSQGKRVFATSSFQTQSLPLLHILSQCDSKIPIAFVDTGFLFPETYIFRDYLIDLLDLNVVNIKSEVSKSQQMSNTGQLLFTTEPDRCCSLNKVIPLRGFVEKHDVWISGVRADQSATRSKMSRFHTSSNGIMRYHPMLEWSAKMVYLYRQYAGLPEHPLEAQGYLSIGCQPCTSKYIDTIGSERSGRWSGRKKEECGLHTDLA